MTAPLQLSPKGRRKEGVSLSEVEDGLNKLE